MIFYFTLHPGDMSRQRILPGKDRCAHVLARLWGILR